jgi:hypothetical protein
MTMMTDGHKVMAKADMDFWQGKIKMNTKSFFRSHDYFREHIYNKIK